MAERLPWNELGPLLDEIYNGDKTPEENMAHFNRAQAQERARLQALAQAQAQPPIQTKAKAQPFTRSVTRNFLTSSELVQLEVDRNYAKTTEKMLRDRAILQMRGYVIESSPVHTQPEESTFQKLWKAFCTLGEDAISGWSSSN